MTVTTPLHTRLERVIAGLHRRYPGPGGAIAVLREGEVVARHAWGWANAERRIPFTPKSLFRMCSITKQFTCATLLDVFPDPSVLDADVRAHLPNLLEPAPGALHLCHNQSGLRDYWAVAMLHGSPVEAPFGDHEATRVIEGTRSLQFAPGTRNSYCNQNFRILSRILEERTGRSFAELLRSQIFEKAGMESAFLAADSRAMPDGSEGYEGDHARGFRAARNQIIWTGDAGLGASLDDMIAWEKYIDAMRGDPDGLYQRLCPAVSFADGAPASYGFGLARGVEQGRAYTGHGGALRGWRSNRLYSPAERISVVVMFNHLSHAHLALSELFAAAIDAAPTHKSHASGAVDYAGAYIDPETGISARVEASAPGQVSLRFGHAPEALELQPDGSAGVGGARLRPTAEGLWMDRPAENHASLLRPLTAEQRMDASGRYRCAELDAEVTVVDAGGAPYGGFSGFLGQGRMELLDPVGTDVWALPCPRALDHTPPGDWTLAFERDGEGPPSRVRVGCWLARNLVYERVGG